LHSSFNFNHVAAFEPVQSMPRKMEFNSILFECCGLASPDVNEA